jgi:hypothetical protein
MLACIAASAAWSQSAPVYGDAGGCARAAGQPATTDRVFILTDDQVERFEAACPIETVQDMGDGQRRIDVLCSGEGETWQTSYVLTPLPGEDGFLVALVDRPTETVELRRCP